MTEIELLVELHASVEAARQRLSIYDFKGSKPTIDIYYYDPLRDNLKLNKSNKLTECCRVRTKNNRHFVAYKVDIYEGATWKYSDENETEVNNLVAIKHIFTNLGLKELVTIENIKHTYQTQDFEIVVEEVKGLGNFLEVEYTSLKEIKTVEQIKADIHQFIVSLNLNVGQELNSGKPELFLLKHAKK